MMPANRIMVCSALRSRPGTRRTASDTSTANEWRTSNGERAERDRAGRRQTVQSVRPPSPARRAIGRPRAGRTCWRCSWLDVSSSSWRPGPQCGRHRAPGSCRRHLTGHDEAVRDDEAWSRPVRRRLRAAKTILSPRWRRATRGRFVEDEDGRVLQNRAGDAETLALSPPDSPPPGTPAICVSLSPGQPGDELALAARGAASSFRRRSHRAVRSAGCPRSNSANSTGSCSTIAIFSRSDRMRYCRTSRPSTRTRPSVAS